MFNNHKNDPSSEALAKDDLVVIGQTNFRDQCQLFGMRTDDRRRHLYIVGKTGMGKSVLLHNLASQDVQAGRGVCVIDPHGDLVTGLLAQVPASRTNDVIYFNPGDQDFPIAFNPLEKVSQGHQHLVVSNLIAVFQRIWHDSWGPRLEHILRNILFSLVQVPGTSLLGVQRMLQDKKYRQQIIRQLHDPFLRRFWLEEAPNYFEGNMQAESLSPILNKVGQFLSAPLMRNMLGQAKSAIDLREVIDDKKILLVNLSKGALGDDNSRLLGALLVTKLQLAAMSRVDQREDERVDFYLYVDEFQNYATESFAAILSEARKYRLNLTLAHQFADQLPEEIRQSIFGNVGSMIAFQTGLDDAELLSKEFGEIFSADDLVNLPRYHIYLRLLIDGSVSRAFSATTLPPAGPPEDAADPETLIRVSRERYAVPRQVVEDRFIRWIAAASGRTEDDASVASEQNLDQDLGQEGLPSGR